jgi:uncharacterized RDD family membrane protein YckC
MAWQPPPEDTPAQPAPESGAAAQADEPAPPVRWEAPPQPTLPEVAPGLTYAGTLVRIVAYLVDTLIIVLLAAAVGIVIGLAVFAVAPDSRSAINIAGAIVGVSIQLVYFVGLWTSSSRATFGMRLSRLQIGNAADGRTLTPEQAVKRWLAMGFPLALLALVPVFAGPANALLLLWVVALAISVAVSPTKQGLHDRFAGSAVVQPAGASNAGAVGCLLLLLLLLVIPVLAVIALVLVGGDVATLLSEIGSSI